MDYFAGLDDISMDETRMFAFSIAKAWWFARARPSRWRRRSLGLNCRKRRVAVASCVRDWANGADPVSRVEPTPVLPVVCIESRRGLPGSSSRLPPTRPIATTREDWRTHWLRTGFFKPVHM